MSVQWSNYKGGEGEGGWEVKDDLDLPEDLTSGDLMTSGSGQGEEDYFVPSPGGQSVTQGWTQSWQLLWIDSLSLKLAALIDTLTLTQAGSSYGQTQGYMVVNGTTYYIIRIIDH
ncbi:hypothetical protein Pmani_038347 [Petrolisthes manimaculis]|uniref:Coatomer alpha subunit C-terminal domain-containing protein n=1 Tax=Petrolisthes manimaculis TaxID=1843537 RepID=A0AAE1NEK5_9EUCA|nr:hypothetical protein Pmani_038347 [Petrolisthes manimaculis]